MLRAVAAAAFMSFASAQAQVQVPMDPAIERQVDEAYRQVLERPDDLARWSRYAQIQVQGGNYEGGIGALERLMLQPNYPPEVPLEIAVLYYRLGSYAQAETLARQALSDSRLPAEQRQLAQRIADDAAKRNQRSQLNGLATFGLRSQSNPAYRTSESDVLSGGVPVPVAADQRPKSDWDANLGLRLDHLYDFDLQNSAALSTRFGALIVDYHDASGGPQAVTTSAYDLRILDLNVGVQFKPMATQPGLTLRPHVSFADVNAQGKSYLRTEGVGLDVAYRPDERTLLDVTVDVLRRRFVERVDLANAADLDGRFSSIRARLVREVASGQVLTAELGFRRNSAERNFQSFDQQEARVSYALSYAAPAGMPARQWTTTAWAGVLHRDYDAADPAYSATTVRKDDEWRIGLIQTIPLADQWFAAISVEHARNRSNLPNFRYRNTSVSASVMRTF